MALRTEWWTWQFSTNQQLLNCILGRPTSMSADLCFTTDSSFVFFFIFRHLISELAEQNSTKIGHMLGSNCDLKTHIQNLAYPLPLQIEGPKTTFYGWLRNLTATVTAYIFRTKHDIDNRASVLTTTRGLLCHLKTTWILVHKRLQTFLPTLCKFCTLFHCQALQTEIGKWNSNTLCRTMDGKSHTNNQP